jgi:calmodulin
VKLCNGVVKDTFKKYDKDNGGNIDKNELQALSTELGRPLTIDELGEALLDLDLNKDGVIDFNEFKRWWFSGFKSYSGTRRTLLKLQK